MPPIATPTYFSTAAALRRWFAAHHARTPELWLGYYKKGSGIASVSYADAVDEALCVGWIDGVARGIDAVRYMQRFTPRRPNSNWSKINVAKAQRLIAEGRMKAAGLRAFEARTAARTGIYSFEQDQPATLSRAQLRQFRGNKAAWTYFQAQAPWYRRTAIYWVTSAKRAETRESRLATLIADSAAGVAIKPLRRPDKR